MSFTVYQTNKKTRGVYAYLQTAFRDPVSKRPKSKRTYLGRVDPITGEIVPKETDGKRNRSKLGIEAFESTQSSENSAQTDNETITSQRTLIEKLSVENERLRRVISNIRDLTNMYKRLATHWIEEEHPLFTDALSLFSTMSLI